MRRWFRFFLGSPLRATLTILTLVIFGVIHNFFPGTLQATATGVAGELSPLLNMVFSYGILSLIVFLGYRLILSPLFGKKSRKKK